MGWGNLHDVSEHTHTPDVCGRADWVSLHHLRSCRRQEEAEGFSVAGLDQRETECTRHLEQGPVQVTRLNVGEAGQSERSRA